MEMEFIQVGKEPGTSIGTSFGRHEFKHEKRLKKDDK